MHYRNHPSEAKLIPSTTLGRKIKRGPYLYGKRLKAAHRKSHLGWKTFESGVNFFGFLCHHMFRVGATLFVGWVVTAAHGWFIGLCVAGLSLAFWNSE